jgi:hypothetical protein
MIQPRIAIIGISGIGKEHARALSTIDPKLFRAVVDFPEIIDRECGDRKLSNVYPGSSFIIDLPAHVATIPNTGVSTLKYQGITHAIVATPPDTAGRAIIDMLTRQQIKQLVEKPYALQTAHEDVFVNYQLSLKSGGATRVDIGALRPEEGHWRWRCGGLLWDLGGHALSMLAPQHRGTLRLTRASRDYVELTGDEGVHVVLSYHSEEVASVVEIDGVPVDFRATFDDSVLAFVEDRAYVSSAAAISIEDHLRRIDRDLEK